MVKATTIALAIMATISPFAAASNCQTGLQYCGYNLLKRGNYYAQIVNALEAAGYPTDSAHVENTFFQCLGGSNGDIEVLQYCSACQDGGSNHSDSC
ncbi:uncharacterized protein BP01DRAFT_388907 [Aspergillus saccharolyticus JOP 1030-1]|uniref:Uncharacterized protein n=1 Tax=Aspergillus saccharolyticus JOP 1030-1 TaxID=1450539 RepID=A0A318ZXM6_9EURO|nr:hypothetical protein BP01DRAFT_388907 [Aspergillus saccharolyticus JOP 1030-1]PYH49083.1 hypothetical protein BP01DRAFT_388907 [Aspergillus saccharolyticus JOP 1030-1]